jgi:flagellar hook-length control protein FliK
MIINPLFIKIENPGIVGEAIKNKFYNSSYLFSDIIKVIGLQEEEQTNQSINISGHSVKSSTDLQAGFEKTNFNFTDLNIQSVPTIVASILKQNGINPLDNPMKFNSFISNINKLAQIGQNFNINLIIDNKNIKIEFTSDSNNNPDINVSNLNSLILSRKTLPVNNVFLDSTPISLAKAKNITLTESNNIKLDNSENVVDNNKKIKLNPEKDLANYCAISPAIIVQTFPQLPITLNSIYPTSGMNLNLSDDSGELENSTTPIQEKVLNPQNVTTPELENKIDIKTPDEDAQAVKGLLTNENVSYLSDFPQDLSPNFNDNLSFDDLKINNAHLENDLENMIHGLMVNDSQKIPDVKTFNQINSLNNIVGESKSKGEEPALNMVSQSNDIVFPAKTNFNYITIPKSQNIGVQNNINSFPIDDQNINKSNRNNNVLPLSLINNDVTIPHNSEQEKIDPDLFSESKIPIIKNNSGKIISENDMTRMATSEPHVNDSDKVFNLKIEISENPKYTKIEHSSLIDYTISKSIPLSVNSSEKHFPEYNNYQNAEKLSEIPNIIGNHENNEKTSRFYTLAPDEYGIKLSDNNNVESNIKEIINKISPNNLEKINENIVPLSKTESVSFESVSTNNNIIFDKSGGSLANTQVISEKKDNTDLINNPIIAKSIINQDPIVSISATHNDKEVEKPPYEYDEKSVFVNDNLNSKFDDIFSSKILNNYSNNGKIEDNNYVTKVSIDNNLTIIKSDLKPEIQQVIQTLDNNQLEIQPLLNPISKEQKLAATYKTNSRKYISQPQKINFNSADKDVKNSFSKYTSGNLPFRLQGPKDYSPSIYSIVENSANAAEGTNIKTELREATPIDIKQTITDSKPTTEFAQVENSNTIDSTKSKKNAIESDEIMKSNYLKNNIDDPVERSLVSNAQNIAPIKPIGVSDKNIIKLSVPVSNSLVQPDSIKVNAEDVVKEIHRVLTNDDSKRVVLNLHPEDLGNVKIDFEIKGKSLNARISVETESAKTLIQTNSETLKNALHESGITLNSFNVLLSDGPRHQNVPIIKKKNQKNEVIDSQVEPLLAKRRNLGYNTYEYLA